MIIIHRYYVFKTERDLKQILLTSPIDPEGDPWNHHDESSWYVALHQIVTNRPCQNNVASQAREVAYQRSAMFS